VRYLRHTLIAEMLRDRLLEHVLVRVVRVRPLGLDENQGQPIDEAYDVGTPAAGPAGVQHIELIRDVKAVVGGVLPIEDGNGRLGFLAVDELGNRNAEGQLVVDALVGGEEALAEARRSQLANNLVDGVVGKRVFLTFPGEAAFPEFTDQHLPQEYLASAAAPQLQGLGWPQVLVAHGHEDVQGRDMGAEQHLGFGKDAHRAVSKPPGIRRRYRSNVSCSNPATRSMNGSYSPQVCARSKAS